MRVTRVYIPLLLTWVHVRSLESRHSCVLGQGGGWTRGCRSEPQRNRAGCLYEDGRINQINSFKHLIPEVV